MPSGGQRSRSEIDDAEPDDVLDGRVSSRKMKVVQIQVVAAERNCDGSLEVVAAGVAVRELSDVLPAKSWLRVRFGPQGVAVSNGSEPVLAIALALGEACLGDIELHDSESGLNRYLRRVEAARSPKAEGESLCDVDE
jgi:hypothetical protein